MRAVPEHPHSVLARFSHVFNILTDAESWPANLPKTLHLNHHIEGCGGTALLGLQVVAQMP